MGKRSHKFIIWCCPAKIDYVRFSHLKTSLLSPRKFCYLRIFYTWIFTKNLICVWLLISHTHSLSLFNILVFSLSFLHHCIFKAFGEAWHQSKRYLSSTAFHACRLIFFLSLFKASVSDYICICLVICLILNPATWNNVLRDSNIKYWNVILVWMASNATRKITKIGIFIIANMISMKMRKGIIFMK